MTFASNSLPHQGREGVKSKKDRFSLKLHAIYPDLSMQLAYALPNVPNFKFDQT